MRHRNPLWRTLRAAVLFLGLAASTSSCMILNHMLDPRPPGAPNLALDNGLLWRQEAPMDLNGKWVDADGTVINVDVTQGIGRCFVETEDAKFFWTDADMLVKGQSVQVERRLGGDSVDSDAGVLDFEGEQGTGVLVVRFKELGTWQRQDPIPLAQAWVQGQTKLTLTDNGGGNYTMTSSDPAAGWTSASGYIHGAKAHFDVVMTDGSKVSTPAKLTVGIPYVTPEVQSLLPN